jgi:hypothetical protein
MVSRRSVVPIRYTYTTTITIGNDAKFLEEYTLVAEVSEMEGMEPQILAEAKQCLDWLQWDNGIKEELEMLRLAGTWKLVDHPRGDQNIVGSKWVFRAKTQLETSSGTRPNSLHKASCRSLESTPLIPMPLLLILHLSELSYPWPPS